MALIWADKVAEATTTTGTGALTLTGPLTGYQAFSAVMTSPSDTCYYTITAVDGNGIPTGEWETGLGTYSALNTLTRTTVHASTNAGAAVSFAAGVKRVTITHTANAVRSLGNLLGMRADSGASTSAYAGKGGRFTGAVDLVALAILGNIDFVSGASYKAYILELSGDTVTTLTAQSNTYVATSTVTMTYRFELTTQPTLARDTSYALMVYRTDGGGTTSSGMRASTGALTSLADVAASNYIRHAATAPVVTDVLNSGVNAFCVGLIARLP